jgi:large subunit ribosomal protein L23
MKKQTTKKIKELDSYDIVKYPLSTEKTVRLMQEENKLLFVVSNTATKKTIKAAIEKMFNVKVSKVNLLNTPKNEKRAYVRLSYETPAIDVATDLGLI